MFSVECGAGDDVGDGCSQLNGAVWVTLEMDVLG
jgi:hypothetical protein